MKVRRSTLTWVLVLGAVAAGGLIWKSTSSSKHAANEPEKEAVFQPAAREARRDLEPAPSENEPSVTSAEADAEFDLVEVSPLEVGVSEDIAIRYDQAYLYTGTAVPGSEPKPMAHPEMPAGTVTEEEMRAKEDRLVELYPALEKKVRAARVDRAKSAADYQARGMSAEDWSIKNEVQLEQ